MSTQITRRDFLEASALTFCVPTGLLATEENEIVLRFAAMSDVHYDISHTNKSQQHVRFARAIRFMNDYAARQKYNRFDALVVAGDFSNRGVIEEIGPFKKTMDDNLKPETKRVLCMGNHEFVEGSRELWEKTFETPGNRHQIINGYHFITISPERGTCSENDYVYALEWLEKNLAQAQQDDPKKTIFVIQHYHVHSTVAGSYNLPGSFPAGVHDFQKTLRKYPQVFHLSGHSHVPTVDPRAIWQGEFTAIGTGSMSYFGLYLYDTKQEAQYSSVAKTNQAGTFLLFDVFRDGTIRVKLYDTISDSFLDREYLVVDPGNVEKYIYTNKRFDTATRPVWPAHASALVKKTTSDSVRIEFPQASDEQCLTGYRIEVDRWVDSTWKEFCVDCAWSDYFLKTRSPNIIIEHNSLLPKNKYRVRVFAMNTFKKTSFEPLVVEFETPPDGPCADRDSLHPQADVIDLVFEDEKPVNRPANPKFKSELRTLGTPDVIHDSALGTAIKLNGTDQCLLVPVKADNYRKIRVQVSLAANFRLDLSQKGENAISIFGNTQSGGLALEYRRSSKLLSFVCYFCGKYEKVEAPFDPSKPSQVCGVYDGEKMLLYANGELLASKEQTGRITYTRSSKARAFCIGGDVTHLGDAQSHAPGIIARASVYSWALTPEQAIARCSNPDK